MRGTFHAQSRIPINGPPPVSARHGTFPLAYHAVVDARRQTTPPEERPVRQPLDAHVRRTPFRRLLAQAATSALVMSTMFVVTAAPSTAAPAAPRATIAAGATAAEVEDNGSTQTANPLALGTTVTGRTSDWEEWGNYDDLDVFRFTLPRDSRLNIALTFPSGLTGSAYDVTVYNSAGHRVYGFELAATDSTGAWSADRAMFLPAGTGYVEIAGEDGDATWGKQYRLTLSTTPGKVETEPNNSFETADTLALATPVTASALGDGYFGNESDFFRITLAKASRVNLTLTFPQGLRGQAYELAVYDARGAQRYYRSLHASAYGSRWTATFPAHLTAGVAYVEVMGHSTDATWGKQYELTVTATPSAVETEDNDSIETADALRLGTTTSASIFSTDWSAYEDTDFYRVTLDRPTDVVLQVETPETSAPFYEVWLWNADGAIVHDATIPWDRKRTTLNYQLPAGTSFISVHGTTFSVGDPSAWGKEYRLTVLGVLKAGTPRIAGTPVIGKTLTAKPGTWGPSGTTLSYQWYRGGKAIAGATGTTYKVRTADAGRTLKVKVTGRKAGYATTSSIATRTVSKAKTQIAVSLPASVSTNARVPVTIKVTSAATARPTGTLLVHVDGVRVKKTLKPSARGTVTVWFPKVARAGTYQLSVNFTPSGSTRVSSTARAVYATLRVV